MPLTRFDTIFCRPKPTPTPTAPENKRERGEIDPDRAQHDQHREGDERDADELAEQHLDRRREVLVAPQPPVEEVAGGARGPQRQQQQRRGLERQQRGDPQSADDDAGGVQRVAITSVQQAEDAERRDRPGDDRHHAIDELVADQARQHRDHDPGGGEAGGDPDQVCPAGQSGRLHRNSRDQEQADADDDAEIVDQDGAARRRWSGHPMVRETRSIRRRTSAAIAQPIRAASAIRPSWIGIQTVVNCAAGIACKPCVSASRISNLMGR